MPTPYVLDRAGGPMVWVSEVAAYVHLLPVTKLQFERFLCDQPGAQFDQKWYDTVLALDPDKTGRVSPYAVKATNYWQAFATAVRPDEARVYARWCAEDGTDDYALPTQEEWFAIHDALRKDTTFPPLGKQVEGVTLTPRMLELVHRLEEVGARVSGETRTRADQAFLRGGVFEWVECRLPGKPEWGGLGQPGGNANMFSLDRRTPKFERDPNTTRFSGYGFRLLRRAS